METNEKATPSKGMFYTGWVLTILAGLALLVSGIFKFFPMPPEAEEGLKHIGWRADQAGTLGILEVVSVLLYLFPRTAVVGAILVTGYMGGAIATHMRVGDVFIVQAIIPIVAWLGLWLRDGRLRELLPFRS